VLPTLTGGGATPAGGGAGRDEPNNSAGFPARAEADAVYRDIQSPLVQGPGFIDNLRPYRDLDW